MTEASLQLIMENLDTFDETQSVDDNVQNSSKRKSKTPTAAEMPLPKKGKYLTRGSGANIPD